MRGRRGSGATGGSARAGGAAGNGKGDVPLPGPGEQVRWYLELAADGQFVARYRKVGEGDDDDDDDDDERGEGKIRGPAPSRIGARASSNLKSSGGSFADKNDELARVDGSSSVSASGGGGGLNGRSMTLWWLKLSGLVALNGTLLLELFDGAEYDLLHKTIFALRGCCAVSGICVGVCYYLISLVIFPLSRPRGGKATGSLAFQLYTSAGHSSKMSFDKYVVLDTLVHAATTSSVAIVWFHHISPIAATLAFLFHRWWSLWNSGFRTVFFRGDEVYKLKPLAKWVWSASYGFEVAVIASLFLLSRNVQ